MSMRVEVVVNQQERRNNSHEPQPKDKNDNVW